MKIYKPQEIADRMIEAATALTEIERLTRERDEAREEVERLARERDAARYFLKIFVHAHANNNAVPWHIEEQARKALEDKP